MSRTVQSFDYDLDDEPIQPATSFPVYKQMGSLELGHTGEGPLVAMARLIQDDAEQGGSYIVKLEHHTFTVTVELDS